MLEGDQSLTVGAELERLYAQRFGVASAYRNTLWNVLVKDYFQRLVPRNARLLDLGCGYAQFVNAVRAEKKYAMDLNPHASTLVNPNVLFFLHDCSQPWPLEDNSLDVVFTSNFLEHLPDKNALQRTMFEAARCLAPNGKIICLGPNFRFVSATYWDFWDHHIPISDRTIRELLQLTGFQVLTSIPRFLPYTLSDGRTPPIALVRAYLSMPFVWPIFGRQFLVVGQIV